MIQQFHFWVYTQKNWQQGLKGYLYTFVHSNIIHNSPKAETTIGRTFWPTLQHGWTLRTSCEAKQASHQKANAVWLHFYEVLEASNS